MSFLFFLDLTYFKYTVSHVTECSLIRPSISDSVLLTLVNGRCLFSKGHLLSVITTVIDLERKE